MHRTFLLAKIHNCRLTAAHLNYTGSISIDQVLLDASGILAYEQVQVLNLSNGKRLITYVIPASAHSGAIELNGAAARLGVPGDRLIILTYGQFLPEEVTTHSPKVVFVNEDNQVVEIRGYNISK